MARPRVAPPPIISLLKFGPGRTAPRIPDYQFSPGQRSDLAAYLARTGNQAEVRSPLELVHSTIRELRCLACHDRDARPSPRRLIIAEESERGVLPEILPDLTWAGEKLHADWTRQLLAGRLKHPSRPWLKARMPAFGAWADHLAAGLAAEHGVSFKSRPGPDPDRALAALGAKLTLKQNGFNCLQCHGVGKTPAIAPGFFRTALTAEVYDNPDLVDHNAKMTAIGRNGEVEDIDGITVFLAAPASDYITGQVIGLDGGYSAK